MSAPSYTYEFCDREYDTRRTAPDWAQVLARRQALCEHALATLPCDQDIPYGTSEAEKLDIFPAAGNSRGVLMFIHGGYWQSMDKRSVAFLATALTEAGVTLALIDYALAPAATMDKIIRQCRTAAAWLWHNVARYGSDRNRIHVGGNSAGAHLAAMVAATDWQAFDRTLPPSIIHGCLAISGIYDLEPIRSTRFNAALQLDADAVRRCSPSVAKPTLQGAVLAAVGGLESAEFHRQTLAFVEAWKAVALPPLIVQDRHHSNILLDLVDPGTALFSATMDLMSIDPARTGPQ
jgi:arylformamidase